MSGFKHVYTLQPGERAHLIPNVGAMVVHPMHAPKIVDSAGKITTIHLGHPPSLLQRTAPPPAPAKPVRTRKKKDRR